MQRGRLMGEALLKRKNLIDKLVKKDEEALRAFLKEIGLTEDQYIRNMGVILVFNSRFERIMEVYSCCYFNGGYSDLVFKNHIEGIKYDDKIKLIKKIFKENNFFEQAEKMIAFFQRLNTLRNSLAHGDYKKVDTLENRHYLRLGGIASLKMDFETQFNVFTKIFSKCYVNRMESLNFDYIDVIRREIKKRKTTTPAPGGGD